MQQYHLPLRRKAYMMAICRKKMAFLSLNDNKCFALSNIDTSDIGINVRLINISDKKASCTLSLIAKPKSVKVVNFLGEEVEDATAKISANGIKITAGGTKIVTLNIEF